MGCACARNAGNVLLATNFKGNHKIATRHASRPVRDACVVLYVRLANQPSVAGKIFTAHAQPAILRIWQEAHCGTNGTTSKIAKPQDWVIKTSWLYYHLMIRDPWDLLTGLSIPIVKMKRSHDHLVYIIRICIRAKIVFLLKQGTGLFPNDHVRIEMEWHLRQRPNQPPIDLQVYMDS